MRTVTGDYSKDISIDRMKLDEECEFHVALFDSIAEEYADAKAEKDTEKDRLDLITAERDLAIREDCVSRGIKTTEAIVSAMVTSDKEVVEQKEKYRLACAKFYTLDVAMSGLDHRKSQLDNLVKLWLNKYYTSNTNANSAVGESQREPLNY